MFAMWKPEMSAELARPELKAITTADSPVQCSACGRLLYYYLTRMGDMRLCDPCLSAAIQLQYRLRVAAI